VRWRRTDARGRMPGWTLPASTSPQLNPLFCESEGEVGRDDTHPESASPALCPGWVAVVRPPSEDHSAEPSRSRRRSMSSRAIFLCF
jgi:hypothetical protein